MVGDLVADYLGGLPSAMAEELARVNGPGLAALRGYLASGAAVAFLGAGVSAPLYPLWDGLIGELIDAASGRPTRYRGVPGCGGCSGGASTPTRRRSTGPTSC
jgi:hypothetical protein